MSGVIGFAKVLAGEVIGDILLSPRRQFGGIIPDVVIDESHADVLAITEHPVESGAPISDHAYLRPPEVKVRMGWSPSSPAIAGPLGSLLPISAGMVSAAMQLFNGGPDYLQNIYQQLLTLQATREPFNLTTGKRTYKNMLIETLLVDTNSQSEYALMVTCNFKQIIIVRTVTATTTSPVAPQADQAAPQATAAVQEGGTVAPRAAPALPLPPPAPPLPYTSDWYDVIPSPTSPTGFRNNANIPLHDGGAIPANNIG